MQRLQGSHRLPIAVVAVLAAAAIVAGVAWAVVNRGHEGEVDYSPYGRVVDESGEPVAGAAVLTRPVSSRGPILTIGVGSGPDGRFVDTQIAVPGDYRITVSAEGFRDRSEAVHIGEDGWKGGELEFVLQRE